MALVAPLKGILYNKQKIGDLRDVVSPPYDVVTPEEQAAYHQSHPQNVMHLILGAARPEDQEPYEWHHRAAIAFNQWRAQGLLVREARPAIYYTETDFTDPTTGQRKTRHGFICLLRLEEFGTEARVRPHELTFSATTAERLHLMEHVQANLSPVFAVFPDEKGQAQSILEAGLRGEAWFDFTDVEGRGHRVWPIRDRGVIRALGELMLARTVYIADGHHRYETALRYRRLKAERGVQIVDRSPLNYLMVYLCPISDPGLTILPAHRLISRSPTLQQEELEAALERYFQVQRFSFQMVEERLARQAFLRQLQVEGRKGNTVGLYTRLARTYYLLRMRNGAGKGTALESWPQPLQKLDTVVLNGLVFNEVMGLSDKDLDDPTRISYTSQAKEAIGRVNQGQVDLACILNPTRIEQVQSVAEAGLIMPRKSTYFFPKVITGLVFNPLDPFEEIQPAL